MRPPSVVTAVIVVSAAFLTRFLPQYSRLSSHPMRVIEDVLSARAVVLVITVVFVAGALHSRRESGRERAPEPGERAIQQRVACY